MNGSRAADHPPENEDVAPIEGQDAVVGDIPGNTSGRATVAELECTRIDGRSSSVGVISKENGRSSANLLNGSRAADHAPKSENVGQIEDQDAVVGDISGDASGRATITELQRSGLDSRSSSVGVISKENGRSSANLLNATRAADHSTKGENVAPIEGQGSIVSDITGYASGRSTVTELNCSATDHCLAGVGVVPGQKQSARSQFCQVACTRNLGGEGAGIGKIEIHDAVVQYRWRIEDTRETAGTDGECPEAGFYRQVPVPRKEAPSLITTCALFANPMSSVPFSIQVDPAPVTVTVPAVVARAIRPTPDPELVSVAPPSTRREPLTTSSETSCDGMPGMPVPRPVPERVSEAVMPLTITPPVPLALTKLGVLIVIRPPMTSSFAVAPGICGPIVAIATIGPPGPGIVAVLTLAISAGVGGGAVECSVPNCLVQTNQWDQFQNYNGASLNLGPERERLR